MFKYWSIKKYGSKLLPALEKRYGVQISYSAHQIRSTVYKKNFNPKYLPLAYIMFLSRKELQETLYVEYPELNVDQYKHEIMAYLASKSYQGLLQELQHRPFTH